MLHRWGGWRTVFASSFRHHTTIYKQRRWWIIYSKITGVNKKGGGGDEKASAKFKSFINAQIKRRWCFNEASDWLIRCFPPRGSLLFKCNVLILCLFKGNTWANAFIRVTADWYEDAKRREWMQTLLREMTAVAWKWIAQNVLKTYDGGEEALSEGTDFLMGLFKLKDPHYTNTNRYFSSQTNVEQSCMINYWKSL